MQDKVDIVVWNMNQELQKLLLSPNPNHQVAGRSLDMFLKQDALGNDPYNFGKMKNMYILKYKGLGQKQMHIIGATSPATLFFSLQLITSLLYQRSYVSVLIMHLIQTIHLLTKEIQNS